MSLRGRARRAALFGLLLAALAASACSASLPDPDSPGARLYAARCGGPCHRLYAPGSMTAEMWRIQVERMRAEFARRGIPWLEPEQERLLLEYLSAHSLRS